MAGATLQPILDRLNSVPQYHPGNADTFADWTLEAGDIVRLKRMGENYDSPVMVNTMRWNGQAKSTLEFDGQKERKAISKVSKQKFGGGGGGIQNSKDLYTLTQNFNEEHGDFVQYVTGPNGLINSGLWQGKDHIEAIAGDIEFVEDPTTHVKTMVLKSGGGIKIRRDNVEYGLYDSGNLTAGIIVSKINGGTTRILGKNVVIDGDTTINGSAIASSLEGEDIACSNLSVGVKLTATNASVTGGMDVGYLEAETVQADSVEVNGRSVNIVDASVNTATNTLTITKADGTTINFSKAGSGETPVLRGNWSGAHLTVTSDPAPDASLNYYFGHTLSFDPSNPNKVLLTSQWRESAYSPTGTTFDTGEFNVQSRYNAGWTAAYNKVSLPSGSTSSAFSIQTPGSVVDGSAITTAYAINDPVINGSDSYIQVKNSGQQVVAQKDIGDVYDAGFNAVNVRTHRLVSSSVTGKGSSAVVKLRTGAELTNQPVGTYYYVDWTDSAPIKSIYNAGWTGVSAFKNNSFPAGTWSIESGSGASANVAFTVHGAVLENDVTMGDMTWRTQPTNIYRTAYSAGVESVHPTLIDYWSDGNVRIISNPSPEEELNRKLGQGAYSWNGNTASGNIVVSFNGGTTYYGTGATYSVDATGRYNAGWGAAYGNVELPGSSTSSSFLIKTPGSTVDGAAIQTAYAINEPVINGSSSYIQVKNSGNQVVAQKNIGGVYTTGYSDGRTFEDTKIAGAWNDTHTTSDATYTVSSPLSASLFTSKVYLTQDNWSNGSKYVYLRSGSTSGTSRARLTVSMPTTATWTKTQMQTILTAKVTIGGKTYTHDFDI